MQNYNLDTLKFHMLSLEESIKATSTGEFHGLGIELKSVLISAVIGRFNLTFDVCRQILAQKLADRLGKAMFELAPEELFLKAAQEGMITNLHRWLEYLAVSQRNTVGTATLAD